MKRGLLSIIAILFCGMVFAQDVWSTKVSRDPLQVGLAAEEKGYCYAGDSKGLAILDSKTGAVFWDKKFKELVPSMRKVDEIIPLWEANAIFLFDRKLGKDKMAVIDVKNGTVLWESEKYQNVSDANVLYIPELDAFALSLKERLVLVKTRTGEEVWEMPRFKGSIAKYIFDNDDKTITMINYQPSLLKALFSGFKNQIMKINAQTGETIWEATYIGVLERKVVTKEFVFDMSVIDDKLMLTLNGMQVYNYKTGSKIWECAFDETPPGIAKRPSGAVQFGVYDAIAKPIIVGDFVYLIDMKNKRKQFIKKYNLNTGALVWTSPEIQGAKAMPNMYLVDGKIVLQIGGAVQVQAIIRVKHQAGDYVYYTYEPVIYYPIVKPLGLQCFNEKDGSKAWESERFKKDITQVVVSDGYVLVGSGKALYSLDLATGNPKYEIALKAAKIGKGAQLLNYKDKVVVIGTKGMATYSKANGQLISRVKSPKKARFDGLDGDRVYMYNKKGLHVFNLETMKLSTFIFIDPAKMQAMETNDRKFIYIFNTKGNLVTKKTIN